MERSSGIKIFTGKFAEHGFIYYRTFRPRLFMFGRNGWSQLGFPTGVRFNRIAKPHPHPSFDKFRGSIASIGTSQYHSIFVLGSGDVYSCGRDSRGATGQGIWSSCSITEYPKEIAPFSPSKIIYATCGVRYTLFLSKSGKVYSCGFVYGSGQLGYGDSEPRLRPGPCTFKEGVFITNVECGYNFSLFLSRSAHVYFSGSVVNIPRRVVHGLEHVKVRKLFTIGTDITIAAFLTTDNNLYSTNNLGGRGSPPRNQGERKVADFSCGSSVQILREPGSSDLEICWAGDDGPRVEWVWEKAGGRRDTIDHKVMEILDFYVGSSQAYIIVRKEDGSLGCLSGGSNYWGELFNGEFQTYNGSKNDDDETKKLRYNAEEFMKLASEELHKFETSRTEREMRLTHVVASVSIYWSFFIFCHR